MKKDNLSSYPSDPDFNVWVGLGQIDVMSPARIN